MKRTYAARRVSQGALAVAALGACATQAAAQGLPSVPGLTELQQPVATTLQTVCMNLGQNANPSGTPAQRLQVSCNKMVISSFANQGPIPPELQAFNLNISNDQIATGVQAIAPVQSNSQKPVGIEAAKMNSVSARLLDVRSGVRGVVMDWNGNRTNVAGAGKSGEKGGAAGPDDALSGPWGGFVNVAYSWGKVDQTTLTDAYDYGSFTVLAGADYRVSDAFVVGGALAYSHTDSSYDFDLGDVKADTFSISGYATYYQKDWYVDAYLSWGDIGYDTARNIFVPSNNPGVAPINARATASPKGTQWSFALGAGYNYQVNTVTLTPTARLGYIWVKNDAFSEDEPVAGLGLAVNERTIRSLQSALGGKVSTTVSTSSGVFGPYLTANWMHEFENDAPSIVSKYVADPNGFFFAIPTASPTRDYAIVTLGSTATLPNQWSGFCQFSAAIGLENETNYGLVLGIRKQF